MIVVEEEEEKDWEVEEGVVALEEVAPFFFSNRSRRHLKNEKVSSPAAKYLGNPN